MSRTFNSVPGETKKKEQKKKGKPRGTGRRGNHFLLAFKRSFEKKIRRIKRQAEYLNRRRCTRIAIEKGFAFGF